MAVPFIVLIAIIIIVFILALPTIISAVNSLYSVAVNQGPQVIESVKILCNLEHRIVSDLVDAVENQPTDNENIEDIIELYRKTGEITDCDVRQLVDVLDSEQRKRLKLNDVICDAWSCLGN